MARVLVIGGTGVISTHSTSDLLGLGHEIVLLRRGTARAVPVAQRATTLHCDRNDPGGLARAIAQVNPEILIDFACFTLDQASALSTALNKACRQLIFVSTVDVYGLPLAKLPMPEEAIWSEPGSAYAAEKRRVEVFLREALAPTGTALTILRPTYSMGAAFMISLFDRSAAELVARLRLGAEVLLPDEGVRLIHPSDARDTGRMAALATDTVATFGRDYTVGTPDATMSQKNYLGAIARALGVKPMFKEISSDLLKDILEPQSLWLELTHQDLSYDLSRFLRDVPSFRPSTDFAGSVHDYAGRLDPASDTLRAQGPEARALQSLSAFR